MTSRASPATVSKEMSACQSVSCTSLIAVTFGASEQERMHVVLDGVEKTTISET